MISQGFCLRKRFVLRGTESLFIIRKATAGCLSSPLKQSIMEVYQWSGGESHGNKRNIEKAS